VFHGKSRERRSRNLSRWKLTCVPLAERYAFFIKKDYLSIDNSFLAHSGMQSRRIRIEIPDAVTRNQKKHFLIQIARRVCQITVPRVMMLTIYLSLYAHYRSALALEEQKSVKSLNGRVLNGIDDPQPEEIHKTIS